MKILICITELNDILKYINYVYNLSDTEKSENASHDRYRTSEYNETNALWRILFRLFCKMKTNVQVHLNKLECRGKVHLFQ